MASFVRGNMMDQFRKPITALKRANGASSGGVGREAGGGGRGATTEKKVASAALFREGGRQPTRGGACRDCFTGATFRPWRLSLPTPRKGVGVGSKHRGGKILPAPTCDTAATRAPLFGASLWVARAIAECFTPRASRRGSVGITRRCLAACPRRAFPVALCLFCLTAPSLPGPTTAPITRAIKPGPARRRLSRRLCPPMYNLLRPAICPTHPPFYPFFPRPALHPSRLPHSILAHPNPPPKTSPPPPSPPIPSLVRRRADRH